MIRAIEETAAAEERGVFRKFPNCRHRRQHQPDEDGHIGHREDGELCCEKHALRIERSAVRMVEERLKDTSDKVFSLLTNNDYVEHVLQSMQTQYVKSHESDVSDT